MEGAAIVEFGSAGSYAVRVYGADGRLVASQSRKVQGGERMQISLAAPGAYIVKVQKDGVDVRNVKLLNR